jgi:Zn-dependent peptidase ImmA (M78 family)
VGAELANCGIRIARSSRSVFSFCDVVGVNVKSVDLKGQRGAAVSRYGSETILIDSRIEGNDREFVMAHELGHLLVYPAIVAGAVIDHTTEESICDQFAALVTGISRPSVSPKPT